MLDAATLAVFAAALAIAAGSPGPSIAALVARVLSRGPRSVLPFLAAMWIGEAIWLACAVFGLAVLAQSFQLAFAALKWAGIAYLLWLAWKMWRAPVAEAAPLPADGLGLAAVRRRPRRHARQPEDHGLLPRAPALDPRPRGVGARRLGRAHPGDGAVLIVVDLAWVLAAAQARRLFRTAAGRRLANRLSAGMMAGAAGAIAAR